MRLVGAHPALAASASVGPQRCSDDGDLHPRSHSGERGVRSPADFDDFVSEQSRISVMLPAIP